MMKLTPLNIVMTGLLFIPVLLGATQVHPTPAAVPNSSTSEDSGQWRRDPFISNTKKSNPPATDKKGATPAAVLQQNSFPDIQIQGIIQSEKSFHALINGRSVKAGDTIDGVTIKEISRFRVVVLNERKDKIIYDIYQGRIDRGKK